MVKLMLQFCRYGRTPANLTFLLLMAVGGFSVFASHRAIAANVLLPHAAVRLLPGAVMAGVAYIGIDIAMEPGVKTYWRTPGDSGLPPVFNWSGSENLSHATVEWPLPERIADPAGTVLGYHDRVIFPVRIEAKDASKPVRLSLKLDYAVCAEICVPLSAEAGATLDAKAVDPAYTTAINAFRARIPMASTIGGPIKPALENLTESGSDLITLTLDTPVKDLILEGPDGWYFGDASSRSDTIWQIRILQKPSNAALAGVPLTLTLIGDEKATETAVTLDASGAIR